MEDLNNYEAGQPLEMPITQSQRNYIQQLLYDAVLDPDKKDYYLVESESNITYGEAEGIIEELKKIQLPMEELARIGRLKRIDFNKALKKLVDRDNT